MNQNITKHGFDFLPLLPRQIVIMRELDAIEYETFEPSDDRRGIVRYAGIGFRRRPSPRSLATENR